MTRVPEPSRFIIPALILSPLLIPPLLSLLGYWYWGSCFLDLIPGFGLMIWAAWWADGMKEFDPCSGQFDNVIDLLKGYPCDWVKSKAMQTVRGRSRETGTKWTLHDNVVVADRQTFNSYGEVSGSEVVVLIHDPQGIEADVVFTAKREYAAAIREAIEEMQTYRQMKTMVRVALDADEREKKKPKDKAMDALHDYQQRHKMNDPTVPEQEQAA